MAGRWLLIRSPIAIDGVVEPRVSDHLLFWPYHDDVVQVRYEPGPPRASRRRSRLLSLPVSGLAACRIVHHGPSRFWSYGQRGAGVGWVRSSEFYRAWSSAGAAAGGTQGRLMTTAY